MNTIRKCKKNDIHPAILSWFNDSRKPDFYKKTTQDDILENKELYLECDSEYINEDIFYFLEESGKKGFSTVTLETELNKIKYHIIWNVKYFSDPELDYTAFYIKNIIKL